MKTSLQRGATVGLSLALLVGCQKDTDTVVPGITLTPVATSSVQWTGVTVSQQGTVFACFPRIKVDLFKFNTK